MMGPAGSARGENVSDNHIVMLCTVPDHGSGQHIALALVEERLAACVNLVPNLVSIYRWEGKLQESAECLLIIKTVASRFDAVRQLINLSHPAAVPEIIALPIAAGAENYLAWITESTT